MNTKRNTDKSIKNKNIFKGSLAPSVIVFDVPAIRLIIYLNNIPILLPAKEVNKKTDKYFKYSMLVEQSCTRESRANRIDKIGIKM